MLTKPLGTKDIDFISTLEDKDILPLKVEYGLVREVGWQFNNYPGGTTMRNSGSNLPTGNRSDRF